MSETALTFGPDWIRAYSAGAANIINHPASTMPIPKYSLAEFRYGREEMLALIPKEMKFPSCLKDFPHVHDQFQMPLALIPMTEDEQRLWTRSVNSDQALRVSGKNVSGMGRTGRGGSVDRGRGRGRGGYYQRGLMHDDPEDNQHGFSRPKPVERSLSANERDLRWDDRDRRYDRPYSGRGAVVDDGSLKQDNMRVLHDYWRKCDKDDDGDWRSSGSRSSDRLSGRGSWRNTSDRERRDVSDRERRDVSDRERRDVSDRERRDVPDRERREVSDRNLQNRNAGATSRSGPSPHKNHNSWKDSQGNHLPEWSVEETNETDSVGTFDSSGAFLETKTKENTSLDEIYISDDADDGLSKDSPEADSSKKMPKKSPNSSNKRTGKRKSYSNSAEEDSVKERTSQDVSEISRHNSKNSKTVVTKSTSNVIKTDLDANLQQPIEKEPEFLPVTHPNVPIVNSKNVKAEESVLSNLRNSENVTPTSGTAEEDAFAHHKKATENMVAQWTQEEEQQAISHTDTQQPPHEKEVKWFYQDPQGDIQGPFTSSEMFEWFSAGYFNVNLMVRRNCDDKFSELGDLIKSWGRVPFRPGSQSPPIRAPSLVSSLATPITQTSVPIPPSTSTSTQLPKQDDLLALQRQLFQQQLMQQQLIIRQQAQMQALLTQLKQQDSFTSLTSQQQQQVLMHHIMTQQQMPRPNINPLGEQSALLDPLAPMPMPLLGLTMPPVINDMSLWNATGSGTWPMNLNPTQPPGTSIWDVDLMKPNSEEQEAEKQKKLVEEQEKIRKIDELRLEQAREAEEKRMKEEKKCKKEALMLQELQKQEEFRRLEELKRQQEELKQQEELRHLEEQRRQEEELKRQDLLRQEELRKQEEFEKLEEQRKQELKRQEELQKQEEQRQLEELQRKEEQRLQEEIRRQHEKKLEEKRKKEEMIKEEKRKQTEREQEKLLELERQKEALRLKEIEREERFQAEKREREELELMKLAELKLRSQGPVWGIQNAQSNSELSLADIQRLQEEKEMEEREEKIRQQSLQQQTVKQVQQNKNGLSWAKRATDSQPAVKSLIEIQQEEAERLAFMQRTQKPQPPPPTLSTNAGVWGNTSHLNKIVSPPQTWNMNNVSSSTGFWDEVITSNNTQSRKQPQKTNETSAFPALANRVQPATVNSNKSKSVRAKKEEDAVTRLFGSHHKPTDEFTKWCTDAISSMPSSVDVPTFVAFLKDIESPYEVFDYVKSYLGEGKEPREFAKLFLEKRSKFRNQGKQAPAEENTLWGPAPAITPTVNKPVILSSECDGNSNAKGKAKRRKNRMQKLDNSMLGFTVQSNPDRLNVGEIDHIDGM